MMLLMCSSRAEVAGSARPDYPGGFVERSKVNMQRSAGSQLVLTKKSDSFLHQVNAVGRCAWREFAAAHENIATRALFPFLDRRLRSLHDFGRGAARDDLGVYIAGDDVLGKMPASGR